jgi:hypothetical protein
MVAVSIGCDEMIYLMRVNVGDKRLQAKPNLLLVGSCVDRFPDIVKEVCEKNGGHSVLHVCLEETHVNQAGFKIGSIVRYSGIKKVTVLTVDGSPHCVQLHYVVEDIRRHFAPDLQTAHYVIEKGNLIEISPDAVKKSRHLSKVQGLLND